MSLPALDPQAADLGLQGPVLLVVVDTEEEFDWSKPFDRGATATRSIPAQDRAHSIYDRYGVVPTYVMDHPVATSPQAVRYLRRLVDAGRAEFGTHCHPWVTPPHSEAVNAFNSFHGNLKPELEAAKIAASTDAVAQAFGQAPRIFKAGRYGLGPRTFETLKRLGYSIDCSFVPHTSYAPDSGPDFYGTPERPFFTDASCTLLEVPLTVGYSGRLSSVGRANEGLVDAKAAKALRLPGIFSRLGLLERARLSPEGFDLATQCRLLRAMSEQGTKVFTISYHSPSLEAGHTPYVRSAEELGIFLHAIDGVLRFFQEELGGSFTTLSQVERLAREREPERESVTQA